MEFETRMITHYGQFAAVLEQLKSEGWTGASIRYVVNQVFWEDEDE